MAGQRGSISTIGAPCGIRGGTVPDNGPQAAGPWRGAMLALLLLSFAIGPAVNGDDLSAGSDDKPKEAMRLGEESIAAGDPDALLQIHRLTAGSAFLEEEVRRLESTLEPARELLHGLANCRDASALQATFGDLLQTSTSLPVGQLSKAADRLDQAVRPLTEAWLATAGTLLQNEEILAQVRDEREAAHPLTFVLGRAGSRHWWCGLVAVGTLFGWSLHADRHAIRRRLKLGSGRGLRLSIALLFSVMVMAAMALLTFTAGDWLVRRLLHTQDAEQSWRNRQAVAGAELQTKIEGLQQARDQLDRRVEEIWHGKTQSVAAGEAGRPKSAAATMQLWRDARTNVQRIREAIAILEALPRQMDADVQENDRVREEIAAENEALRQCRRLAAWTKFSLVSAMVFVILLCGSALWVTRYRRRRRIARTCPVCLSRGGLRLESVSGSSDGRTGQEAARMIHCGSVSAGSAPGEACDYRFAAAYRDWPRLSFPTIGAPAVGKTRWLAMAYHRLVRGEYPPSIALKRIRTESGEQFDRLVSEIMDHQPMPAILPYAIPRPLVFDLRDRDPWGRGAAVVNVFDYSGQVTSLPFSDPSRQRALIADGYIIFLDPTQGADVQAKAMTDLAEDLRLVGGLKPNEQSNIPAAICLSKIDELLDQGDTIGSGVDRFFEGLQEIDPAGRSLRSSVLGARSRLTADLARVIWKNWDVERYFRELFGNCHAFFPLTSTGLRPKGQAGGQDSFIDPFGTIEPLLWLLHMNGHPVLE